MESGWRSGKVKSTAYDYQNAVSRLKSFEKRIRNVMIECLDLRGIIQRYDSPNTFFYIDPPYVGRERCYKGGFTKQDHIDLAKMLRNIKGKALVSYYPDPLIESLYKGWKIETKEAHCGNGIVKAEKGQTRKKQTELFIMNYGDQTKEVELNKQQNLFTFGTEVNLPT